MVIVKYIFIFVILSSKLSFSQDESLIEKIYELFIDENLDEQYIEIIDYYQRNKINLRDCNPEELAQLPLISIIDAFNIVNLVSSNDKISYDDIAEQLNLDDETIIILKQCTKLEDYKSKKTFLIYRSRYQYKLEENYGIANNKFLGDKLDLYQRLLIEGNKYSLGVLIDKDYGERDIYDFSSFYFNYKTKTVNLIVGDFVPKYGMGGVYWEYYGIRKGSDVVNSAFRFSSSSVPNRSSLEDQAFRGIALDYKTPAFFDYALKSSVILSKNYKSATINIDSNVVTSIYNTGLYRTENEISKKNNLEETAIGIDFQLSKNQIIIGGNFLYLDYSKEIKSLSSKAFFGKQGIINSYYLCYFPKNMIIGSELTYDALNNYMFKFAFQKNYKNVDIALNYRYIQPKFRSPYGYTFGEFSSPSNEQGIYTAIFYKFNKKLDFSIYNDIYSSIERTYFVPSIVKGIDLFFETNYKIDRDNLLIFRIRNESKTDIFEISNQKRINLQKINTSLRAEIQSYFTRNIYVRLRSEISILNDEKGILNEKGLLLFYEMKYTLLKNLELGGRFTIFSTDSYETAIWQFEYISKGYLRNIALDGNGSRLFVFLNYNITKDIELTIRYSELSKNFINTIGSGYDKVNGNMQSNLLLQLDLKI